MKTAAIIGANARRADGHAAAYALIDEVRLVAASARTPGAARDFAQRWAVDAHYTDYAEMLATQRPDIVHVNVPPANRRKILEHCEAAGVAGVVLEKPVGVDVSDLAWLTPFAANTRMRIVVNHQLHYHRSRARARAWIREGRIGQLAYVEGSARHLLGYQGTHVLEGMLDLVRGPGTRVVAFAEGPGGLDDPGGHFSPDALVAHIQFARGITGCFKCGEAVAPEVADPRATERHHHKRLLAVGDAGTVEWTMWGLRLDTAAGSIQETFDYDVEDLRAQADLVRDLSQWMDGGPVAKVDLGSALEGFALALAMYRSVVQHSIVDAADPGGEDLLPELRSTISSPH